MQKINLTLKKRPQLTTAVVSVTDVSLKMTERKGHIYTVTVWKSKKLIIPNGMHVTYTENLN
jgi:hypothetical protein